MEEDIKKFVTETPLYEKVDISDNFLEFIKTILCFQFTVDIYCPQCQKEGVFNHTNSSRIHISGDRLMNSNHMHSSEFKVENKIFNTYLVCSRNSDHFVNVAFYISEGHITKVGQYPSIADLQFSNFAKFKNILEKKYHNELMKAIGLKSHGVGIGSFVYLRRIFEKLIDEAYQNALADNVLTEEEYASSRVNERIGLLKNYLPIALVEHKELYGILSKGVHELDENICLEYHDVVLHGIEMILEEKVADKLQKEKAKSMKKKIQAIKTKIM